MSESELAKRLRGYTDGAGCQYDADLLAAAEIVERAAWRPISEAPSGSCWVAGNVFYVTEDKWVWRFSLQSDVKTAVELGYTHFLQIAPPEVKP